MHKQKSSFEYMKVPMGHIGAEALGDSSLSSFPPLPPVSVQMVVSPLSTFWEYQGLSKENSHSNPRVCELRLGQGHSRKPGI